MESEQDTRTYFRSLTENATLLDKLRQATAVQRMFRSKGDHPSYIGFGKTEYKIPEMRGGEPESFTINGGTGDTPNGRIWTSGIGGSDTLDDREHNYEGKRFTVCAGATYELMREVFDAGEEGIEALKTVLNETGDCPFKHLKLQEAIYRTRMKDARAFSPASEASKKKAIEKYGANHITSVKTFIIFHYIEEDGKIKCICSARRPGQRFEHLQNHGFWAYVPCFTCYDGEVDISQLKGSGTEPVPGRDEPTWCSACAGKGRVTELLSQTNRPLEIPCVKCCKEFRELKGTGRIDP